MRAALFATSLLLGACSDDNDADYRVVATLSFTGSCESPLSTADGHVLIGVELFDVTDPASPRFVANLGESGELLAYEDGEAWLWQGPRAVVVRDAATQADVHRLELPGEAYGVQAAVTDDALVVLATTLTQRSALVTFDRASLPATGVPLPSAVLDLPGKRSSFSQDYNGDLAARGDLIVVGGNPSALAIDVSDPFAPVITDRLEVRWGLDVDALELALWVGFDGDGELIAMNAGHAAEGPRIARAPLSADGTFGDPAVVQLAPDARGKGPLVIAGDTIFTGAGFHRLDGAFLGFTPAFSDSDGPCGFASDGERLYVHVINSGVSVVEAP